jgi:recombination protein RecT
MTAQTITRALEKRDNGVDKLMWAKKGHLESILPDHLDVKGFLGTAWAALLANDRLMQYAVNKPDTLLVALYRCAALGHQPGTDEFYLTPRDGGVLGIEGYRGIVERMYRSGAVRKVVVREVCAKDKFRYLEGIDERPVHSIGGDGESGADFFGADGGRDRGEMVGVYAYAELVTGAVSRVVLLDRQDVLAARDSGGYKPDDKYTPWNRMDGGKDRPGLRGRSMWWKTAARRLEPWVPTSAEFRREQLRATAAAVAGQGPLAAAEADGEIHEAEVVEQPSVTGDGTLPIENPPDWPEARKPGSGLPDKDGTGA